MNEGRKERGKLQKVKLILTASSVAAAHDGTSGHCVSNVLLLILNQRCEINHNCQQRSCRTYRACVDSKLLKEEYVNHGTSWK
jgi:hypothetical protein